MAKTNHSNVYLVRHTALDTLRVAKVIRKADMDSDTILREARLIKNLKHSHIPVIYDIEEDDISICIIEEYISGKSLRSYINDTDNIKTSEICDIAVKLCDILEYLHNCDNEIIHLDIKPDNIIIDEHNNVKLIDFGSSIHKAGLTQAGMISPGYAAPEQYSGKELTYQTDIYSVGMVLKFMADSNSTVHNKLYPVINKCTRHNQYRRYKNVKALRWELEQTARSDITFFQKMGFNQKIKFINKNAINKNVINKTSSTILNNTYADESENVSVSVLENYKINSIYGIKNYSYIIKVSGSRRGIGVTHTVLSMAHCLGDYGLKCLVIEGSGRTDILQTALADNSICSTSEGLLICRGIWLMPSYGRDETQGVNYDIQDNFDIVIIDSGVNSLFKDCDNELKNIHMDSCNERVMIDSYGYEAIMNDNNSKIINICVVGGKYDVRSESSLIDETDKICHNSIIFVNLVNEVQFYGYSNTIADKKSCYRVPCIYEWYENNAAWTLIMKDFMQDNLTALWENIDAGQKRSYIKYYMKKYGLSCKRLRQIKELKQIKGLKQKRKSRELLNQYKNVRISDNVRTIGVAGLCDSAGATYVTIMLAVFFTSVLKRKTAVVGDIKTYVLMKEQMCAGRTVRCKKMVSRHAYSINGIDFYGVLNDNSFNILKDNYDIVIIDIDFGDAKDTFARMTATLAGCDKKMLIGSMLPWKFKECIKKIERMGRFLHIKGLTMYTLTNGTKENEQLLQDYGVKVELTPIERNPFMISGENLHWFMKLLVPSYKGYNGEIR